MWSLAKFSFELFKVRGAKVKKKKQWTETSDKCDKLLSLYDWISGSVVFDMYFQWFNSKSRNLYIDNGS